ncbi:putative glycolipid-binding domain-containing protein [Devosia alba]|uniref:putative glycolipid-binding domain-containing protein n=1 Tax=Devosia alba TaxID=3152360 RepID=UPI0032656C51
MSLDRSFRWRALDPEGLEHCHVTTTSKDTRVRGAIITLQHGLFYRLKLDETGHVRTVRLERADGKVLELFSDGAGNWSDDRAEPLPELRGCIDVDISATPLTNSLPLWRCDWIIDQPQRFTMAWIDADAMSVQRHEQVYTRLDDTRFRFQSVGDGFERIITVDADGLVLDYPGLFVRTD